MSTTTLPRKALISISSFHGAIYPNGKKTGLFFTEALHPFEVLTQAGFEVDIASETGTYGLDEISLTDPFLTGSDKAVFDSPKHPFKGEMIFNILDKLKSDKVLTVIEAGSTDRVGTCHSSGSAGRLTASIAHEINQPLGAVVNNASACLRWLKAQNLEEARQSASLVIEEGHRAGEIINRVRALAKKAPPQRDLLDINETISEVLAMARNAAQRNRIVPQTQLANDLPLILGDRIQLQQVILNLLVNAIEAMSEVNEGPRELWVSSQKIIKNPARGPDGRQIGESEEDEFAARALADAEGTCLLIAVRDSGPSLDPKGLDRLFDDFYTTKPQGLGMGLAISRSIIEAHGDGSGQRQMCPEAPSFSSPCRFSTKGFHER